MRDYMKELPESRKQLVEDHLYLVDIVAKKVRKRLPQYIDFDFEDLIGYGYIGLVDAGIKFDKKRGYRFNTYANRRVEGAIIDGMRKMDWMTQGLRRKKYKIEKPISIDEIINIDYDTGMGIEDKRENFDNKILVQQFLFRMLMHLEWKRYCSLYMRFIEGYKEKEIAEMLGVTPSRISQVTSDGRRIMGEVLADEWKNGELSF